MKSLTALHTTALAALLFASATVPAFAADLIVEVEGLRSNKGNVSVGLFDKAETFPTTFAVGQRVPASAHSGNVVEIVFRDLKPGSYALSAYQDENENQELDRGMFGIPKEPYGFSRDALGDKGPPEFRDARIEVAETGTRIRIKLR